MLKKLKQWVDEKDSRLAKIEYSETSYGSFYWQVILSDKSMINGKDWLQALDEYVSIYVDEQKSLVIKEGIPNYFYATPIDKKSVGLDKTIELALLKAKELLI